MSADQLAKLKQEVRGVILSCPRGLTLNQFLKDYKDSIGRSFPFEEYGYESIPDLLRDINDVVLLNPGYGGNPAILVPVVNDKVTHINSMVSRQKLPPTKYAQRNVPRRSVKEDCDSLSRRPLQPSHGIKTNSSHQEKNIQNDFPSKSKDNSSSYNNCSGNIRFSNTNNYEEKPAFKGQNSVDDDGPSRYSLRNPKNEYQSDFYSDDVYHKSDVYNPGYEDYYLDEDNRVESVGDLIDQRDSGLVNGMDNGLSDDEFERPPTPGESIISEQMKKNFRELLADHPNGLPSSKFCRLYNERFGVPLKFEDYGMSSFQEMITYLPDVFAFQRLKLCQQWMLFDAQKPIPAKDDRRWIPCDVRGNVESLLREFHNGIKTSNLAILYRERFRKELDVSEFGFKTIDGFLRSCPIVDLVRIDDEEIIIYRKQHQIKPIEEEQSFPLPPISEMQYLWREHFEPEECDPSTHYKQFELIKKDKLNYAKVFACDVISPSNIWLQMDEQREELSKLMLLLNAHYDKFENMHVLKDHSCVTDLVCAVRFEIDNRWHRAKVISQKSSSNTVTVRYVDYGTENDVSVTAIRKLLKLFCQLPVQAIQSSLYGVYPKAEDSINGQAKWTGECINFIYDICFEKKFNLDVLEINESIPKLEVVLYDGKDSVTVNDQLILAGHAVSAGRMKENRADERRVRTPPGYSSKDIALTTSPDLFLRNPSTCERIDMLRKESFILHKKMENLGKEIKQKLMEADVLEQMICGHPHPYPEGFGPFNEFRDQPKKVAPVPPIVVPNQAPPYVGCYRHQPPVVLHNHMPSPYMGGYPPYQQQQNIMPPQNMGQWGQQWAPPSGGPPGLYNSFRPAMFANKPVPLMRPVLRPPQPIKVPTPIPAPEEISPLTTKDCSIPVDESQTPTTGEPLAPAPSIPSAKTSPSEEVPVDVIVPSAPPLDEVASSVDFAEEVMAPEDEVVEANSAEPESKSQEALLPPTSIRSYDASQLSKKQLKKLENSDQISFIPPPNNWSDIFSPTNSAYILQNTSIELNSSNGSQYPNQALLNLIKEEEKTEEKSLKDEFSNNNIIKNESEIPNKPVNYIMKICVQNVHGSSSHMVLVLVGDFVTVLLQQLYYNFWLGEHNDQSYNQLDYSLVADYCLAFTIGYRDYPPIFEQLREDKVIDSDDRCVNLINLSNVPEALDVICPPDKKDLTHIKEMFVDLSKMVLPVDDFWYNSGRSTYKNQETTISSYCNI